MIRSMLLVTTIFGSLLMTTLVSQADSPREFLYKAQQGANSEIMLGRIAAERGRSPAVRDFGQTLMDEHRQARDEIRALGSKFGVRPNRDPSPEAVEERERLMQLSGRWFDREFARYMVEDHEKDIAEFRDEAREGHGEVSALARRQLPTLRHHLEMARALDSGDDRGRFDRRDRNDFQDRAPDNGDWRREQQGIGRDR